MSSDGLSRFLGADRGVGQDGVTLRPLRSALRLWLVWLAGGAALALVLLGSGTRPLAEGVTRGQATGAVAIVALCAAAPIAFVRLWRRRRVVAAVLLALAVVAVLTAVLPFPRSLVSLPGSGQSPRAPANSGAVRPPAPRQEARPAADHTLPRWAAAGVLSAAVIVVAAAALLLFLRTRRHTNDA